MVHSTDYPDSDAFLPLSCAEAEDRGLKQFDVILISGDAYIDHPLFCAAVIGRVLESRHYSVGVIAQPDWKTSKDFQRLGKPRLFFGITSGNVDSMVNAYTARRMKRRRDVYSPGGIPRRPNRATIVYTQRIHALFPDVPIVIGGIEASLRRFAHYDFWEDRVRQSILADAPADLLVFGMGERQVIEIARLLDHGEHVEEAREIPGVAVRMSLAEWISGHRKNEVVELPEYRRVSADKKAFAQAFALLDREQDPIRGRAAWSEPDATWSPATLEAGAPARDAGPACLVAGVC